MEPTEKQISFAQTLGIDNPSQFSKKALSELINAKVGSNEGTKVEDAGGPEPSENKTFAKAPSSDKTTTMYTSYVKDLVIAGHPVEEAINLVKQARDAFS